MKKIFSILIIFGCAIIAHNSFTMFNNVFKKFSNKINYNINKTKNNINTPTLDEKIALTEMLHSIEKDRKFLTNKINDLSQHHNRYTKPSDLLNDLFKNCDKSNTNYVFPTQIFDKLIQDVLDGEFETKSIKHGPEYAWGYITCFMNDNIHNWCDWTKTTERNKVYKSQDME